MTLCKYAKGFTLSKGMLKTPMLLDRHFASNYLQQESSFNDGWWPDSLGNLSESILEGNQH